MFTTLFKKPRVDEHTDEALRQSEEALQQRMNRMMRQNLKVVNTAPPGHVPQGSTWAITKTLRSSR